MVTNDQLKKIPVVRKLSDTSVAPHSDTNLTIAHKQGIQHSSVNNLFEDDGEGDDQNEALRPDEEHSEPMILGKMLQMNAPDI